RRVGQSIGFELLEHQAHLAIELRGGVEIGGAVGPCYRMIRLVGRNFDFGWVGALRGVKLAMRLLEVDLCKEGLMFRQIGPAVGVERLLRPREVPIGLGGAAESEARR